MPAKENISGCSSGFILLYLLHLSGGGDADHIPRWVNVLTVPSVLHTNPHIMQRQNKKGGWLMLEGALRII